jgi:hypothetical protein
MRPFRFFFLVLVLFPLGSLQPKALSWSTAEASVSAASPEMDRLAQALVGDWDTVEMMEPGPFFPEGGSRKGNVHVRLAAGGPTLIYEVHSVRRESWMASSQSGGTRIPSSTTS